MKVALASKDALPPVECWRLRRRLLSAVLLHLKHEDWLLYPALAASPNPVVRELALSFQRQWGNLEERFLSYSARWPTPLVPSQWPGFAAATLSFLSLLERRIELEERDLYPAAQRPDQAAQPQAA